jgi:hypothetical protein
MPSDRLLYAERVIFKVHTHPDEEIVFSKCCSAILYTFFVILLKIPLLEAQSFCLWNNESTLLKRKVSL